ncbi:MAG: HEPN domain-containing protein [Gaiellaceae bacterium]
MPPDPVRAEEAGAWLARARADLRAADVDLAAEPPLPEDAAFHAQQAAEKALKGFLAWHDRAFRKTHSIEELGEQCLALDERLRGDVDRAVPLTEFAWRFRYPGEPEALGVEEAEEAVGVARALYDAVLALLPDEARP